jgi:ribose transport system ATP-binding protein
MPSTATALTVESFSKTFPGTQALRDVSLGVAHGEVLALLGHNGSGKSTLVKALAGFHQPDPGSRAALDGVPLDVGSASSATASGLRFVHQDLGLVLELDAVDNVALTTGYTRGHFGRIDHKNQRNRTRQLLRSFGVDLDVSTPLSRAAPVERTAVAIARALWDWQDGPRVLILDEPTATLPSKEVARLFEIVREVTDAGHAVVYVSHRMDEVLEIADRVVVLSAGRIVFEAPVADIDAATLSAHIAGDTSFSRRQPTSTEHSHSSSARQAGTPALEVASLRGRYLHGIDIKVSRGEILGIAGLLGSGRDEIPYALAGALPYHIEGEWTVNGERKRPPTPQSLGSLGLAFVPADRDQEGLISSFTVRENLTLASLDRFRQAGGMSHTREIGFARDWLARMGVDEKVLDQPITDLSGGNKQRILLARWLSTNPSILILSEPTAGVDVAARRNIYDFLLERAAEGIAVIIASSDLEDLLTICHRIMVLKDGQLGADVRAHETSAQEIVATMEGAE